MTTPMERMARAVEDAMASDNCAPEDIVRAVLQELREPDEGMVEAGWNVVSDPHYWPQEGRAVFTAMIDHLLREGESDPRGVQIGETNTGTPIFEGPTPPDHAENDQ